MTEIAVEVVLVVGVAEVVVEEVPVPIAVLEVMAIPHTMLVLQEPQK